MAQFSPQYMIFYYLFAFLEGVGGVDRGSGSTRLRNKTTFNAKQPLQITLSVRRYVCMYVYIRYDSWLTEHLSLPKALV